MLANPQGKTLYINHFDRFYTVLMEFDFHSEAPKEDNPVPIPGVPAEVEQPVEEPPVPEQPVEEVDPQFGVNPEGKD